jgi:hypothetical protein
MVLAFTTSVFALAIAGLVGPRKGLYIRQITPEWMMRHSASIKHSVCMDLETGQHGFSLLALVASIEGWAEKGVSMQSEHI